MNRQSGKNSTAVFANHEADGPDSLSCIYIVMLVIAAGLDYRAATGRHLWPLIWDYSVRLGQRTHVISFLELNSGLGSKLSQRTGC